MLEENVEKDTDLEIIIVDSNNKEIARIDSELSRFVIKQSVNDFILKAISNSLNTHTSTSSETFTSSNYNSNHFDQMQIPFDDNDTISVRYRDSLDLSRE